MTQEDFDKIVKMTSMKDGTPSDDDLRIFLACWRMQIRHPAAFDGFTPPDGTKSNPSVFLNKARRGEYSRYPRERFRAYFDTLIKDKYTFANHTSEQHFAALRSW